MTEGIKRVGESGVEIGLQFEDAKLRDDFEVVFRAWLHQYKRSLTARELAKALAAGPPAEAEGDVEGYLGSFSFPFKYKGERYEFSGYADLMPLI
ncbi:MAG: hypothetical protein IT201_02245 [Thermoleophilia bacterium]|nr:hypothetical protein [Thermoleophilia bacterium]